MIVPNAAGAAVAVRRAEVRPVEQVEDLDAELELPLRHGIGNRFDAAKSTCQNSGPRYALRGALPNGWLGSVGMTTDACG